MCLPPTFAQGVSGSSDNGSSNSVLAVPVQDLNDTLSYDPDAVALALIPYLKDGDQQVRLLAMADIISTKSKRPEVSQAETDLLNTEPSGQFRDLLELGLQNSSGTTPTGNQTSSAPPRIGTIQDLSGSTTAPLSTVPGVGILDHSMGSSIDESTKNLISRTNSFSIGDSKAYSWLSLGNVGAGVAQWVWYSPDGNPYSTISYNVPVPSSGAYWTSYNIWCYIDIVGNGAANKPGNWHVDVYLNSQKLLTEQFTISQGGQRASGIAIGSIKGGCHIDPTTGKTICVDYESDLVGSGHRQASYPELSGTWYMGGPYNVGKSCQISQDGTALTFTNENGNMAIGHFVDSETVLATGWNGLRGTLSNDNKRINWANGTWWTR